MRVFRKRSKFICQACRKKIKAGFKVRHKDIWLTLCRKCHTNLLITGEVTIGPNDE